MSSWAMHFLKVTGRLAAEVEATLEPIRQRSIEFSVSQREDDDDRLSKRDAQRIEHVARALLPTADQFPVIWYSQYISGYAFSELGTVAWPPGVMRRVWTFNVSIQYFNAAVFAEAVRVLERETDQSEYVQHLRAAIEAIPWANGAPLVLAIGQCLGGTREDDDVHAAANASLRPLLRAMRDRTPRSPMHYVHGK